jgi:hypothetical protein
MSYVTTYDIFLGKHVVVVLEITLLYCNEKFKFKLVLGVILSCTDVRVLQGAKMAKYIKKDSLCTLLFVLFLLTWIATRMTLYPFR